VSADSWAALRPFYGMAGGRRFNNADLGLFVFQYGFDLLDLYYWRPPESTDFMAEAKIATLANRQVCRNLASTFSTYRRFWGLSAGDGPGIATSRNAYRDYAPAGPIDGTAHIMATVGSIGHAPEAVLEN